MKNRLRIVGLASFLFGCFLVQQLAVADTQQVEAQQAANNTSPPIIEYLWQSTGPEFTEQRLAEIATALNKRIDTQGYEVITANILRPQFETEDYDLIWVFLWSSEDARNQAWAHWNEFQATDWQRETAGVLKPESVRSFLYDLLWGYKSPELNLVAGDTFFSTFHFCSFEGTHSHDALQAFKAQYNDWLSQNAEVMRYGYLTLKARFELKDTDFVWLDIFDHEGTRQAKAEHWSGTEAQKLWKQMTSCDEFQFSSTKIRS